MARRKYPEVLSLDEFDDLFVGQQFAADYHQENTIVVEDGNKRIDAVKLFAGLTNGVIYSQVDLEDGERGYRKGIVRFNNTGIYEVVK